MAGEATGWLAALNAANDKGNTPASLNEITKTSAAAAAGGTIGSTTNAQWQGFIPGIPQYSGAGGAGAFPGTVPTKAVVATPAMLQLPGAGQPGDTPLAQGSDLMLQMLDRTLQAEKLRQSAIDQTVSIGQLLVSLQRTSPSQAADLATQLNLPSFEPALSWSNRFNGPKSTGSFGGTVGTQQISLPQSLNAKQSSWLGSNPNVANMLQDIASRFSRPDLLTNSIRSLTPASASLASMAV